MQFSRTPKGEAKALTKNEAEEKNEVEEMDEDVPAVQVQARASEETGTR